MARICHLTVLNPALHSRIFFKEARSQAAAGHSVSIIGQDAHDAPYEMEGIRIVPAGQFSRFSRRRFFAAQHILPLAAAEQADLYQIHSPELLRLGRELKAARPEVKVVYDMHEDYAANVKAGKHYPVWARGLLAFWIGQLGRKFREWGDGLILAEDCYDGIWDFPEERTAKVRNKFQAPEDPGEDGKWLPERPYLLYAGTIAEEWGIQRSFELWTELKKRLPLDFVVAGHGHSEALVKDLEKMASQDHGAGKMHLLGGKEYLPYERIVWLIRHCWAGTALYDTAPHLREKVPTKFYEFMALQKPLFFSENPYWNRHNWRHHFGIEVGADFFEQRIDMAIGLIRSGEFSKRVHPPEVWAWEREEKVLLEFLGKVLG